MNVIIIMTLGMYTFQIISFVISQLKTMIAELYSSRTRGPKKLTLDGTMFGWETIETIYRQEMERAEGGLSRKISGLRYAFVYETIGHASM